MHLLHTKQPWYNEEQKQRAPVSAREVRQVAEGENWEGRR